MIIFKDITQGSCVQCVRDYYENVIIWTPWQNWSITIHIMKGCLVEFFWKIKIGLGYSNEDLNTSEILQVCFIFWMGKILKPYVS